MPQLQDSPAARSLSPNEYESMTAPNIAGHRLLARLIEEARPEILEEWTVLLAEQGLSHQRQAAKENPQWIASSFQQILDTLCAWLLSMGHEAEAHNREATLALYRNFGRDWAQREPSVVDTALAPPRITQAIWRVHVRRNVNRLSPDEFYRCAITLHQLAMDLGMTRVHGYLDFKEQLLASQQETLSHLLDELTHVESRQRHAIALDLHDNLAQRLAGLFNGIQHCEHVIDRDVAAARGELKQLRQVASDALKDARTMIRDLHFGVSSRDRGLAALADYLADLDADTGIRHELRLSQSLPTLPLTQQSLILRVIQEALTNAHKHARATKIAVTVHVSVRTLMVDVTDDGRGFAVDEALATAERRGRMGVIGMRERADLLNGVLSIESALGGGTSIRLTVPMPATEA
jgi:signal transduction histidine kinase